MQTRGPAPALAAGVVAGAAVALAPTPTRPRTTREGARASAEGAARVRQRRRSEQIARRLRAPPPAERADSPVEPKTVRFAGDEDPAPWAGASVELPPSPTPDPPTPEPPSPDPDPDPPTPEQPPADVARLRDALLAEGLDELAEDLELAFQSHSTVLDPPAPELPPPQPEPEPKPKRRPATSTSTGTGSSPRAYSPRPLGSTQWDRDHRALPRLRRRAPAYSILTRTVGAVPTPSTTPPLGELPLVLREEPPAPSPRPLANEHSWGRRGPRSPARVRRQRPATERPPTEIEQEPEHKPEPQRPSTTKAQRHRPAPLQTAPDPAPDAVLTPTSGRVLRARTPKTPASARKKAKSKAKKRPKTPATPATPAAPTEPAPAQQTEPEPQAEEEQPGTLTVTGHPGGVTVEWTGAAATTLELRCAADPPDTPWQTRPLAGDSTTEITDLDLGLPHEFKTKTASQSQRATPAPHPDLSFGDVRRLTGLDGDALQKTWREYHSGKATLSAEGHLVHTDVQIQVQRAPPPSSLRSHNDVLVETYRATAAGEAEVVNKLPSAPQLRGVTARDTARRWASALLAVDEDCVTPCGFQKTSVVCRVRGVPAAATFTTTQATPAGPVRHYWEWVPEVQLATRLEGLAPVAEASLRSTDPCADVQAETPDLTLKGGLVLAADAPERAAVENVLARLFAGCKAVRYSQLHGHVSPATVVTLAAKSVGPYGDIDEPTVCVVGCQSTVAAEQAAVLRWRDRLHGHSPRVLAGPVADNDTGRVWGVRLELPDASYVLEGASAGHVGSLRDLFAWEANRRAGAPNPPGRRRPPGDLEAALNELFGAVLPTLSRSHAEIHEKCDLLEHYHVSRLVEQQLRDDATPADVRRVLTRFLTDVRRAQRSPASVMLYQIPPPMAPSHGRLKARNVVVDAANRVWLAEMRHAYAQGHLLRDAAHLEASLLFDCTRLPVCPRDVEHADAGQLSRWLELPQAECGELVARRQAGEDLGHLDLDFVAPEAECEAATAAALQIVRALARAADLRAPLPKLSFPGNPRLQFTWDVVSFVRLRCVGHLCGEHVSVQQYNVALLAAALPYTRAPELSPWQKTLALRAAAALAQTLRPALQPMYESARGALPGHVHPSSPAAGDRALTREEAAAAVDTYTFDMARQHGTVYDPVSRERVQTLQLVFALERLDGANRKRWAAVRGPVDEVLDGALTARRMGYDQPPAAAQQVLRPPDILDAPKGTKWWIFGGAAAGKSTLLQQLLVVSRVHGTFAKALPVLIPVAQLDASIEARLLRGANVPADLLGMWLADAFTTTTRLFRVMERRRKDGKLLLLLDGIDEAPRHGARIEAFVARKLLHEPNGLVVTSRATGMQAAAMGRFRLARVLPLSREDQATMAARRLPAGVSDFLVDAARPGHAELAASPQLLSVMLATFQLRARGAKPSRRRSIALTLRALPPTADSLRAALALMLARVRVPEGSLLAQQAGKQGQADAVAECLRRFAWACHTQRRRRELSPAATAEIFAALPTDTAALMRDAWRHIQAAVRDGQLSMLACVRGLPGEPEAAYCFAHLAFQEFLCGEELASQLKRAQKVSTGDMDAMRRVLVDNHAANPTGKVNLLLDPWWREAVGYLGLALPAAQFATMARFLASADSVTLTASSLLAAVVARRAQPLADDVFTPSRRLRGALMVLGCLRHPSDALQDAALAELTALGFELPQCARLAIDACESAECDWFVRLRLLTAVGKLGQGAVAHDDRPRLVRALRAALHAEDGSAALPEVWGTLLGVVRALGLEGDDGVLHALRAAARSPVPAHRCRVFATAAQLGELDPDVVAAAVAALHDDEVRWAAEAALHAMPAEATALVADSIATPEGLPRPGLEAGVRVLAARMPPAEVLVRVRAWIEAEPEAAAAVLGRVLTPAGVWPGRDPFGTERAAQEAALPVLLPLLGTPAEALPLRFAALQFAPDCKLDLERNPLLAAGAVRRCGLLRDAAVAAAVLQRLEAEAEEEDPAVVAELVRAVFEANVTEALHEPHAPKLVQRLLRRPQAPVRAAVARVAGELRLPAHGVLLALLPLMRGDPDADVRLAALEAVEALLTPDELAAEARVGERALRLFRWDPAEPVRRLAGRVALRVADARQGALDELLRLAGGDAGDLERLLSVCSEVEGDMDSLLVERLVERLDAPNCEGRVAELVLRALSCPAELLSALLDSHHTPRLLFAMDSPSAAARELALRLAATLPALSTEAVAQAKALLAGDESLDVRAAAAETVAANAVGREDLQRLLETWARRSDVAARGMCLECLRSSPHIDAEFATVCALMCLDVSDDDETDAVKVAALDVLRTCGVPPTRRSTAAEALVRFLRDFALAPHVVRTLGALPSPATLDALAELFEDASAPLELREQALREMVQQLPRATATRRRAVLAMAVAAAHEPTEVGQVAQAALRDMRVESDAHAAQFTRMLEDDVVGAYLFEPVLHYARERRCELGATWEPPGQWRSAVARLVKNECVEGIFLQKELIAGRAAAGVGVASVEAASADAAEVLHAAHATGAVEYYGPAGPAQAAVDATASGGVLEGVEAAAGERVVVAKRLVVHGGTFAGGLVCCGSRVELHGVEIGGAGLVVVGGVCEARDVHVSGGAGAAVVVLSGASLRVDGGSRIGPARGVGLRVRGPACSAALAASSVVNCQGGGVVVQGGRLAAEECQIRFNATAGVVVERTEHTVIERCAFERNVGRALEVEGWVAAPACVNSAEVKQDRVGVVHCRGNSVV